MSRKSQNLRRAKAQYADLPEPQCSIVNAMPQVWEHDLWQGETYNASPLRLERLSKLRTKNMNDLSGAELDWLMFCAMTTVGSKQTVKFLLPRFFAAFFADQDRGWVAEPCVIVDKLMRAEFDSWPGGERKPVLEAIVLAVDLEIRRKAEHSGYVRPENLEAREWAQAELAKLPTGERHS